VVSRSLVSGAAVAVAFVAVVGAQQQVVRLGDADPEVAQLKQLLHGFEKIVEGAVLSGGNRLAERALTIVPDIQLWLVGSPLVSAVPVPEVGVVVDVQIPDVSAASQQMLLALMQRDVRRLAPPTQATNATNSGTPVPPSAAAMMDFDVGRVYGDYVRDALADAIVDYATALPLGPTDRLVIVGRVTPQDALSLESDKRKLVLQLLGSDVAALRSGEITKEEARARIIEFRF